MLFSKPLPLGLPAPLFHCPDEEGNLLSLEDQRETNIILVFYPGDSTPVCTRQLCEFRDQWQTLQENGAQVFGVNPRSTASHKRFRDKHRFPFPLLVDTDQRVARLYNAKGLWTRRTVYLIDSGGIIRFAKRGNPPVEEILAGLG